MLLQLQPEGAFRKDHPRSKKRRGETEERVKKTIWVEYTRKDKFIETTPFCSKNVCSNCWENCNKSPPWNFLDPCSHLIARSPTELIQTGQMRRSTFSGRWITTPHINYVSFSRPFFHWGILILELWTAEMKWWWCLLRNTQTFFSLGNSTIAVHIRSANRQRYWWRYINANSYIIICLL